MYDKIKKFQNSVPREKKIDKLIPDIICTDLQPLPVVEKKGLKKLLNYLQPRNQILSRKIISQKISKELYEETFDAVKSEIALANNVAITTDMWTSIANKDYMSVTAHFFLGSKDEL